MTDAPKLMHVAIHPECANRVAYQNIPVSHGAEHGPQSKWHEYHLARPGQPCSTDEFLERLNNAAGSSEVMDRRIGWWLAGDFTAAMEGLE